MPPGQSSKFTTCLASLTFLRIADSGFLLQFSNLTGVLEVVDVIVSQYKNFQKTLLFANVFFLNFLFLLVKGSDTFIFNRNVKT